MIRRPRLSVLLGIAIVAVFFSQPITAHADEPNRSGGPGPPIDLPNGSSGLIQQTGIVHFQMILGRLELDPPRHRKGTKSLRQTEPFELQERITVSSERGIPSLHYSWETDHHRVIVNVSDALNLHLHSQRPDLRTQIALVQPASGPIVVKLQSDTGELLESIAVPSLYHLQASHPEIFSQHLERLLPYLLPGPSIRQLRFEAETRLLTVTPNRPIPTYSSVQACIEQLSDSRRATRAAAEAELCAFGLPVLRHIDRFPAELLETEQRARLQRVRQHLQPRSSDTPARLASWLSSDHRYWNLATANFSHEEWLVADRFVHKTCGKHLDSVQPLPSGVRIADAIGPHTRSESYLGSQ